MIPTHITQVLSEEEDSDPEDERYQPQNLGRFAFNGSDSSSEGNGVALQILSCDHSSLNLSLSCVRTLSCSRVLADIISNARWRAQ